MTGGATKLAHQKVINTLLIVPSCVYPQYHSEIYFFSLLIASREICNLLLFGPCNFVGLAPFTDNSVWHCVQENIMLKHCVPIRWIVEFSPGGTLFLAHTVNTPLCCSMKTHNTANISSAANRKARHTHTGLLQILSPIPI